MLRLRDFLSFLWWIQGLIWGDTRAKVQKLATKFAKHSVKQKENTENGGGQIPLLPPSPNPHVTATVST